MKICAVCHTEKTADLFYRNKTTGYIGSRCLDCEREVKRKRAKNRTQEQRQKERARLREKAGRAYQTAEQLIQKRQAEEFDREQSKAARQNARQAFDWWLKYGASNESVAAYFVNEPWLNPRLTDAEQYRIKYKKSPEFAASERMRRQITKQLRKDGIGDILRDGLKRKGRSNAVEQRLGYTIQQLANHLEKLFTEGMSWDAFCRGEIHIDHIKPKAAFDLSDHDQWKQCWAISNLQPLWARDNLSKGAKWSQNERVPPSNPLWG